MKSNKHALATAVIAAIGAVSAMSSASAAVVADGTYNLVINATPTGATTSGTYYKFGKDGAWNSSFTTGGYLPGSGSQAMTDNGLSVASNGGPRGSSIGGDGWAGILGITVSGSSFTVNNVQSMGGTIDQTTGAMTLNPTGRLGAFSLFSTLYDKRWNVDDCSLTTSGCTNNGNTLWSMFSTTSATASHPVTGSTTIHGAPVTAQGDVNSDGIIDYTAILVSGGQIGSDWAGLYGTGVFEVWNIQLRSTTILHSGFNVDVVTGTCCGDFAQYASVPVPAAMWLFSSGLLGLAAARRKRRRE